MLKHIINYRFTLVQLMTAMVTELQIAGKT
uniref:Rrf2 family transcriptional regulator n=1 Tax=Syphacia muris TaxID=451379 RepID=A0A0N5ABC7_9BILA